MQSDLMTCVTSVLPRDERFLGAFEVGRALSDRREDDADVPPDRQPKVLVGRSGPGDKRRGFLSFLFETATLTDPKPGPVRATGDPADRMKRQRKNGRFFGTWDSLAGQWLAAGQPHAETAVISCVALTELHLRFVYVQNVRRSQTDRAIEAGACFPRTTLAWTRRRNGARKEFQFGFTDGSWGTLLVPQEREFLTLFPGTLTHKERIP
ncbi:hypothetical protein [Streptomyces lydicus]|uniref:hypothetical protein n=1 Tax=Streptomyces lydicus TaxID=47763 RepID=UPI0005264412|nr:hypothetical protein [Streptomyces lydicus]MDC7338595.1 hypothetical protein [Streptomyces lydicus]UEG91948.1 hypothetical protein LJ741_16150 [Streptomyces lydicus]